MTWSDFYLVCFLVGVVLSVVSFLAGGPHGHLGHFHFQHGHLGGHVPHAPGTHGGSLSRFNAATLTAFLAWFGGAGYLLTRYSAVWMVVGLLLAIGSGVIGASIVFWFLADVLISPEENLNPADYEMIGTMAWVTSAIRADGTGEVMFTKAGTRRATGARSEDGSAIPRDAEVVVTRYENGIAYVRRWEDLERTLTTRAQRA